MTSRKLEVLRGTLDLLTLKAVSCRPMHDYSVAQWIERATHDALRIEEGTRCPVEVKSWTAYAKAVFTALDAAADPA